MVEQDKIVVILLLITIILSVLSVVLVFGADSPGIREITKKETVTVGPPSQGSIELVVETPTGGVSG